MDLTKEDYIVLRKLMFKLLRRKLIDSEMRVVYKMQCIISEKLKELSSTNVVINSSIQK